MLSKLIYDDGRGFDPELQSGKGFGIVGMHERIQSLGGQLIIAARNWSDSKPHRCRLGKQRKLNVNDRTQVVIITLKRGIVTLP